MIVPLFRRSTRRAAAATACVILMAGCATTDLPAAPKYATWSHPASRSAHRKPVLIPRSSSSEYLRSWGVRQVNADPAFRAGLTGSGVSIAVIDTGVDHATPEVRQQAAPESIDLIPVRTLEGRDARHGGEVAGAISAALDGGGTVGVAYGARLIAIRADVDGSCVTECAFATAVMARGIDYALAKGARIIVIAAEGPHRLSPTFEAALRRAAEAEAVVVVSAGNEAGLEPAWPARYAADPRFARSIIAVGASRIDGRLAPWSNRAGSTAARYLAAPGERLISDCGTQYCYLVSGTSLSAPFVAGALALVMQARPDLSAPQAAELLLAGGANRRATAETGRGIVDVGRALELAAKR